MDERTARTAQAVRDVGADFAVLTSADAVCYATGHVVPIEAGASPFAGGPTTAFVAADGGVALVAPNLEAAASDAHAARASGIEAYVGYGWEAPADLVGNYRAAVARAAGRLGVGGVLAIEPAGFTSLLGAALDPARTVDLTPALSRARATKTAVELGLLRQAAAAAAAGQRAARRAARPGISELALFAEIRLAMETLAGARVPVAGDLLSGAARTAGAAGWPVARTIAAGDPVIADLAPRLAGYWGDSCGSFMVGAPTPAYRRLFDAARAALDLALEIMRPGLAIAELDRRLRGRVAAIGAAYPHHSGHSIGTAVHEYPRIVPYEQAVLEADMVLMVEPSAYDPEIGGVRTEWMIRVTPTGCEPVAPFEHAPGTDPRDADPRDADAAGAGPAGAGPAGGATPPPG